MVQLLQRLRGLLEADGLLALLQLRADLSHGHTFFRIVRSPSQQTAEVLTITSTVAPETQRYFRVATTKGKPPGATTKLETLPLAHLSTPTESQTPASKVTPSGSDSRASARPLSPTLFENHVNRLSPRVS